MNFIEDMVCDFEMNRVLKYIKLFLVLATIYVASIYLLINFGLNDIASTIVAIIVSIFIYDTLRPKSSVKHQLKDESSYQENIESYQHIEIETPKLNSPTSHLKLDDIIGLDNVKENINSITSLIAVERKRSNNPVIGHYIFKGNPGTGKTTVGRILGQKFKEMNFLSSGHFIEASRDDLIGQHHGHTVEKTTKMLNLALGGVLFIDEAYSLITDENDWFGKEAINTIVPFMENHRDDFVLIIAGYTVELHEFLNANTGLKSRFDHEIEFKDYNSFDLYKIFKLLAKKFYWNNETDVELKSIFKTMVKYKDRKFGNGREVRKLFEAIKKSQAHRIAKGIDFMKTNDPMLYEIKIEDLKKL